MATDRGLKELGKRLNALNEKAYDEVRQLLHVGLHEDVEVTSTDWGSCLIGDKEQTVTQVFGSACSVSYSSNEDHLWEPLARLVLSASYEATLWSALLNAIRHGGKGGSRRVYLTCLGGGVFGNPMHWIVDAMDEAFTVFRKVGLEVYIVTYAGPVDRLLEGLEC